MSNQKLHGKHTETLWDTINAVRILAASDAGGGGRAYLAGIGCVEHVRAEGRELRRVRVFRARIGGEVGRAVELLRIDEERDNHAVGLRQRRAHEAQVPLVQGAHGRHHGNVGAFATVARSAARVLTMGTLTLLLRS